MAVKIKSMSIILFLYLSIAATTSSYTQVVPKDLDRGLEDNKEIDSIVFSRAKIDTVYLEGFLIRPLSGRYHFFIQDEYLKRNTIKDYFNDYIKEVADNYVVFDTLLYNIMFKEKMHVGGSYPFPARPSLEFLNILADSVFLFDNYNYSQVYKYNGNCKYERLYSVYRLRGKFIRVQLPSTFRIAYHRNERIRVDKNKKYYYFHLLINDSVSFQPLYDTYLSDYFYPHLKLKKVR